MHGIVNELEEDYTVFGRSGFECTFVSRLRMPAASRDILPEFLAL